MQLSDATQKMSRTKRKLQKHRKEAKVSKNLKLETSNLSESDEDSLSSDSDIALDPSSSSESDEDIDEETRSGLQWVTKITPMKPKDFSGPAPGSKLTLPADALPLDYFLQSFPGDIWKDIATSSNAYVPTYEARRRKRPGTPETWTDSHFKKITEDDIKTYIGIRIIIAIDPKPCAEDYWSTDPALGNAYISQTMPRNRFFSI